jgi:hypothetical protein
MPSMNTQTIIRVSLEAPTGDRWDAIGGGDSVDAALEFALECAPADRPWRVVGWRNVYGD